ncbi:aldehyde oxidase GLOX-like [Ananas comosus]|uniref:Aldehyde oxidase GLOX-like n=1 Tax=Ananas comosus TaxID=4615 RepID=A0A6P5G5S8_ANACO|nr:aldehyde oxidase GLOX-like [Ananas comosus]
MKLTSSILFGLIIIFCLLSKFTIAVAIVGGGGRWEVLQKSIGVSAMHMQLLHNDRVVIFDRTDFGPSNLSLPDGRCRHDPNDRALTTDCTAHSVELAAAPGANSSSGASFRPLTVLTDTWCSSGSVAPDGTLVQTGGFNDGERVVRTFAPCGDSQCDWSEAADGLAVRRWYASNQALPDGRAIVVGGRLQFNYEFYPKANPSDRTTYPLEFLKKTRDQPEENNLYPFVHLNVDGNLFIFANNRAILLDYKKNVVVRNYSEIPGAAPRNYPSSGSSVLLPIEPPGTEAEVLVCGGAPVGSYLQAKNGGRFVGALPTCGRIRITDASPSWATETMPAARVMGDMVLLPSGEVLIINGAAAGTAGWELGRNPVYAPVVYRPDSPAASRFAVQSPAGVARLYHSSAVLLRDGRVLVGGSNPHVYYNFSGVDYPTELSLDAFSPAYLSAENSNFQPRIITTPAPLALAYGEQFTLRFTAAAIKGGGRGDNGGVRVTMVAPGFATHSFSMNQRLLVLETKRATAVVGDGEYEVSVAAPKSGNLAPPGYYMVFVVNGGIPSEGIWARIQ